MFAFLLVFTCVCFAELWLKGRDVGKSLEKPLGY